MDSHLKDSDTRAQKWMTEVDKRVKSGHTMIQSKVDTLLKEQREESERARRAGIDLGERVRNAVNLAEEVRQQFEAVRRPWATEMNNIRRENEAINREMNRMMGEIRDLSGIVTRGIVSEMSGGSPPVGKQKSLFKTTMNNAVSKKNHYGEYGKHEMNHHPPIHPTSDLQSASIDLTNSAPAAARETRNNLQKLDSI